MEGEIQNLTTQPLSRITAVVTWYDAAGGFVTSDDALIEYDPLLPNQKSPFKTMSRTNPAMEKYVVGFRHLRGGMIQTDDRRKK